MSPYVSELIYSAQALSINVNVCFTVHESGLYVRKCAHVCLYNIALSADDGLLPFVLSLSVCHVGVNAE